MAKDADFSTAKLPLFEHTVQAAAARLRWHASSTTWDASNLGGMLLNSLALTSA